MTKPDYIEEILEEVQRRYQNHISIISMNYKKPKWSILIKSLFPLNPAEFKDRMFSYDMPKDKKLELIPKRIPQKTPGYFYQLNIY